MERPINYKQVFNMDLLEAWYNFYLEQFEADENKVPEEWQKTPSVFLRNTHDENDKHHIFTLMYVHEHQVSRMDIEDVLIKAGKQDQVDLESIPFLFPKTSVFDQQGCKAIHFDTWREAVSSTFRFSRFGCQTFNEKTAYCLAWLTVIKATSLSN